MTKECKNCEHWKTNQRELDYSLEFGNCSNGLISDYEDTLMIKIVPHDAFTNVNHDSLDSDGKLRCYQFEFCTNKSFGCNKWEKKE